MGLKKNLIVLPWFYLVHKKGNRHQMSKYMGGEQN